MAAIEQAGAPTIERYVVPDSLEAAVRELAHGDATLFAGSTDLMPQSQIGALDFKPTLMNLRRLPELGGISEDGGRIRIGATATVTEVLESELLAETAPVLVRTADCFGSDQVRNAATIGGNICNASPAGDMILPLIVLDAEVELASWTDGAVRTRALSLSDFFEGPGATKREPGEILTCVRFDRPATGFRAGFRKFGPRPALEVALVAVALGGALVDGTLTDVRVAFGSVAPIPMRGHATEAAIEGKRLDDEGIAAAGRAAEQEIRPISDVRGSDWYRRNLVRVMTERLLADVARD